MKPERIPGIARGYKRKTNKVSGCILLIDFLWSWIVASELGCARQAVEEADNVAVLSLVWLRSLSKAFMTQYRRRRRTDGDCLSSAVTRYSRNDGFKEEEPFWMLWLTQRNAVVECRGDSLSDPASNHPAFDPAESRESRSGT